MRTPTFDAIADHGNRARLRPPYTDRNAPNWIECADGFQLSVIAGPGAYCSPRPDWPFEGGAGEDYAGPYAAVEVGYPSQRPEPWEPIAGPDCWRSYAENPEEPTETVYGRVPVALVRHLIELHGGEARYLPASADKADDAAWLAVSR